MQGQSEPSPHVCERCALPLSDEPFPNSFDFIFKFIHSCFSTQNSRDFVNPPGSPITWEACDLKSDIEKNEISQFLLLGKIGIFMINTSLNSLYPFPEDLPKDSLRGRSKSGFDAGDHILPRIEFLTNHFLF
jgi:hypothetical protein